MRPPWTPRTPHEKPRLAGCAASGDSGTTATDGDLSAAEKAAVIDGGGDPSKYQTAFDQLRKDCADHPSEERLVARQL
jgi:hypothetical protein